MPRLCARDFDRIWLVTTAAPKDPTTELDKQKATVLRVEFSIVEEHRVKGVRVVLLTRR